jgi:hypothetical protein
VQEGCESFLQYHYDYILQCALSCISVLVYSLYFAGTELRKQFCLGRSAVNRFRVLPCSVSFVEKDCSAESKHLRVLSTSTSCKYGSERLDRWISSA